MKGALGVPWVPQKSSFFQGSWTIFSGFGQLAHLSLRAIFVGFGDPKNMVLPREPEVKKNGLPGPLLLPFLGLRRGPSKPYFGASQGRGDRSEWS